MWLGEVHQGGEGPHSTVVPLKKKIYLSWNVLYFSVSPNNHGGKVCLQWHMPRPHPLVRHALHIPIATVQTVLSTTSPVTFQLPQSKRSSQPPVLSQSKRSSQPPVLSHSNCHSPNGPLNHQSCHIPTHFTTSQPNVTSSCFMSGKSRITNSI